MVIDCELKKCPFCSGNALLQICPSNDEIHFSVMCSTCKVATRGTNAKFRYGGEAHDIKLISSIETAAEEWNKRSWNAE